MKQLVFFISFLIFGGITLSAQSLSMDRAVKQLFENPKKIQWVKKYQGKIDGLNDVAITLAYDGKYCKGQMLYLRSNESFSLIGLLKKNEIFLNEIDKGEAISGFLFGTIKDKEISLEWTNYNNTIGSEIHLKEVKRLSALPTHCSKEKWIRIYNGRISGEDVNLILQKEDKTYLRGCAYFSDKDKSYELVGNISEKGGYVLSLNDPNTKNEGMFSGAITNKKEFQLTYTNAAGNKANTVFYLKENISIGCLEYADYTSSYDMIFPKFKYATINKDIEEIVDYWVALCKSHVKVINSRNKMVMPRLRSTVRAYVWTDVDYFSNKIISGFLNFTATWKEDHEGVAFNYDVEKGKEILIEDLFKKNFELNKFVRQYVNKQISGNKLYANYDFRKWLSKEEFPHFTIRPEGINFSTDFNIIYGQQEITIPYRELVPHLKKGNPIAHLIK